MQVTEIKDCNNTRCRTCTRNCRHNKRPKFQKGDWIVTDHGEGSTWLVQSVGEISYILSNSKGTVLEPSIDHIDNVCSLWSINFAKDGDVLCTYECDEPKIVLILKGKDVYTLTCVMTYHCYYDMMHCHFATDEEKGCLAPMLSDVKPATFEQRKHLFYKMKEAGYKLYFLDNQNND